MGAPPPHLPFELSQNFFTLLFYLALSTWPCKTKPPLKRGLKSLGLSVRIRANPWQKLALGRDRGSLFLGVLAAEALHASGGIHQLLFASEKRMAG